MEQSLFMKKFGSDSVVLKVIDFFMDNEPFEFDVLEISKIINIREERAMDALRHLEHMEMIIIQSNNIKTTYKLNMKNSIVKKFMELDNVISEFFSPK